MNSMQYKDDKVFIAGHRGMVGSAVLSKFQQAGYSNITTATSKELDLRDQAAVGDFFTRQKPKHVVLCAAKVGGIAANIDNPAIFLYDNLMIQNNVIEAAYRNGVGKLVFLGSSCIYPRECPQPMKEDYLLDGKLEPTNEGYAIAKIAGIKMIEGYQKQYGFNGISLMPCNIYGPNDDFNLATSHVMAALVKRFVDAKREDKDSLTLWGTGAARREFMHVTDLAEAILFMFESYDSPQFINIGTGEDISIKDLAEMIARKVDYKGKLDWDTSKPDGMMRKCMDVSKMCQLGFEPKISIEEGVEQMINLYKNSLV